MTTKTKALPRESLSVLDGVAIVVGVVVGIGIFRTPPLIAANVETELAYLGVWLLGGALTLVGALCYAELAAAHPNAGGEYHFLARAYGRPLGVLFGWARGTVIQTGTIAAVAFVFGDYAAQLLPLGDYGPALYAGAAVALLTCLNVLGTPQSKTAQLALTAITVLVVVVVAVVGLTNASVGSEASPATAPSGDGFSGALGMAMIFVLLTYGGWNEAAYLSAEVRDSRRNMVRVLVFGTAAVVAIYGIVNLSYIAVFGLENLRESSAVAADLMRLSVGDTGALLLSLVVAVAALSTLNATIFTGARTYYALGQDVPMLQRFGKWEARGGNPLNAIILQGAIALALVGFGSATRDGFEAMVEYTAPVFWFFMLMVGISLFLLRRREPDRMRPFKVPFYPLTPLVFCLTCAYLLYSSIAYTGMGAFVGIAVLFAGTPLLLMLRSASSPKPAE